MSKDNVLNTHDYDHAVRTLKRGEGATIIFPNEESLTNFVYTMREFLAKDFEDENVPDTYGYGHIISSLRKGEDATINFESEEGLRKFVFVMHKILSEGFSDDWAYEDDYDPADVKATRWN